MQFTQSYIFPDMLILVLAYICDSFKFLDENSL